MLADIEAHEGFIRDPHVATLAASGRPTLTKPDVARRCGIVVVLARAVVYRLA